MSVHNQYRNQYHNKRQDSTSDPIGLMTYLVSNLVSNPKDVAINPIYGPSSLVLELKVDPQDIGKIIGHSGRIIKAIRVLLQSIHSKQVYHDGQLDRFHSISLELIEEH